MWSLTGTRAAEQPGRMLKGFLRTIKFVRSISQLSSSAFRLWLGRRHKLRIEIRFTGEKRERIHAASQELGCRCAGCNPCLNQTTVTMPVFFTSVPDSVGSGFVGRQPTSRKMLAPSFAAFPIRYAVSDYPTRRCARQPISQKSTSSRVASLKITISLPRGPA
jgi:hypothetical protein